MEQDIIRMAQVNELLKPEKKFQAENNKGYEIKTIIDSVVNDKEANIQMPSFYYLVLWKGYLDKENTWKPWEVVMDLQKLISNFHKKDPEKLTVTFALLDSTLLIASLMVPKELKQKFGCPSKEANKRDKS